MSKVSEERELIKKYFYSNELSDLEMKKGLNDQFSYINTFLKYRHKSEESQIKRKIKNLSTINILYSVYISYKNIDKSFIKKLEKIRNELSTRSDLFEAVIDFLENNEIIYDDLYFWHPGLKYSDVFSLIYDLIPNIVEEYKIYLVNNLILGLEPKTRILEVFKNRLNKSLDDFDIINKDLVLFKVFQDLYSNHENEDFALGIKRKEIATRKSIRRPHKNLTFNVLKFYKIVTAYFWKENDLEEENCEEVLNMIGGVDLKRDYNKDIELVLCPSLSLIEIEIKGKKINVKMAVLNDLIVQNNRSKNFWMLNGVINKNWEFL